MCGPSRDPRVRRGGGGGGGGGQYFSKKSNLIELLKFGCETRICYPLHLNFGCHNFFLLNNGRPKFCIVV